MEIETLSNYEQNREKRLDNTMDVDLQANEEESVSPVNKLYEEGTESPESREPESDKGDKREYAEPTLIMESESDEECEEEEEKLLLSPAHSDDGGEPLSPVDRDLLDSDCEGEKEESDKLVAKEIDSFEEQDESDGVAKGSGAEEESDKLVANETESNLEDGAFDCQMRDDNNEESGSITNEQPAVTNEVEKESANNKNEDESTANIEEGENYKDEEESGECVSKEDEKNSDADPLVSENDKPDEVNSDSEKDGDTSDKDLPNETDDTENNSEGKVETTSDEKSEPASEEKSEPAGEETSVRAGEKKSESAGEEKSVAAGEEKSKPAGEEKSEPAGEVKSEPADEEKSESAGEEKAESAGEEKSEPAGEEKSVLAGEEKSESAGGEKSVPASEEKSQTATEEKLETATEEKLEPATEEKSAPVTEEKLENETVGAENSSKDKAEIASKDKVGAASDEKTVSEDKAKNDNEQKTEKVETDSKEKAEVDTADRIKVSEEVSEDPIKISSNKNDDEVKDKQGEEQENKESNETNENSLLKESLSRPLDDDRLDGDEDIDMDEDFDPSLLMPELSMEVDEAPVITTNDAPAPECDGSKSPLRLYDPIFSTFVDEMTGAEVDFDLTPEELDLKAKTYGERNAVQFTKIHCTACNIHLGSALDGQGNRFVHPLLKVLICKKCYHFYTSGEFEKDEDGSELYCRWCGQGGQVMCCSNCEMVFCKKCIRINFDRKKLSQIKNSDDWTCFACNPAQLIHLRIHCAEFMEYVQREIRHVGSAANPEAFMNTDYCRCCLPQKKKTPDAAPAAPSRKRKRVVGEDDPDYNPLKDRESPPPQPTTAVPVVPAVQPPLNKTPTVATKAPLTNAALPRPPMLRPVTPQQTRPRIQMVTPSAVRPAAGYIRVNPGGVRVTTPTPTPMMQTRPPALRPIRPVSTTKHEWFEKTVRAAARVNSNLSYTLTQLNRAQANATSVEALAVVHNKLQEILSSSINSLIQIRKNLRTEFIAGIKNIRFPPKPLPTPTTQSLASSKDDDDVIFVPSDPVPAAPKVNPTVRTPPVLPPEISLIKRAQASTSTSGRSTPPKAGTSSSITSKPGPSGVKKMATNLNTSSVQPKGFLRVKSFSALQNVSSECITIPDDPVEDPEVEPVIEKDPFADIETPGKVEDPIPEQDEDTARTNAKSMTNGDKDSGKGEKRRLSTDDRLKVDKEHDEETAKKIKKAKIVLERSTEIDELVKNKFGLVNGNSDESVEN